MVDDGFLFREERECVVVKTVKFFLDADKEPSIADCGFEFKSVSDDTCVMHEPLYVLLGHVGDFVDVKVMKCFSVAFSFA